MSASHDEIFRGLVDWSRYLYLEKHVIRKDGEHFFDLRSIFSNPPKWDGSIGLENSIVGGGYTSRREIKYSWVLEEPKGFYKRETLYGNYNGHELRSMNVSWSLVYTDARQLDWRMTINFEGAGGSNPFSFSIFGEDNIRRYGPIIIPDIKTYLSYPFK
jgi:hypothetical protein